MKNTSEYIWERKEGKDVKKGKGYLDPGLPFIPRDTNQPLQRLHKKISS